MFISLWTVVRANSEICFTVSKQLDEREIVLSKMLQIVTRLNAYVTADSGGYRI